MTIVKSSFYLSEIPIWVMIWVSHSNKSQRDILWVKEMRHKGRRPDMNTGRGEVRRTKPLQREWGNKVPKGRQKFCHPFGFLISLWPTKQGFFLRVATKASPSSPSAASLHHLPVFGRPCGTSIPSQQKKTTCRATFWQRVTSNSWNQ